MGQQVVHEDVELHGRPVGPEPEAVRQDAEAAERASTTLLPSQPAHQHRDLPRVRAGQSRRADAEEERRIHLYPRRVAPTSVLWNY